MTSEQVIAALIGIVNMVLLLSLGSLQWTLRQLRKTLADVAIELAELTEWRNGHVRECDFRHGEHSKEEERIWKAHEDLRHRVEYIHRGSV